MVLFGEAMKVLKKHSLETLQTIPVCVKMCVAYWNPTHPKLQGREFQNAHRTKCPHCKADRFLSDGSTERRRIYYLPFKEWFKDIYTKADLSQYMDNDLLVTDYPSGHVRRSDGWRRKVPRFRMHTHVHACVWHVSFNALFDVLFSVWRAIGCFCVYFV